MSADHLLTSSKQNLLLTRSVGVPPPPVYCVAAMASNKSVVKAVTAGKLSDIKVDVKDANMAVLVRSKDRMDRIFMQQAKYAEPKERDCDEIGICTQNRPPNWAYIHGAEGLAHNIIQKDGYDPERAGCGCIVEHDDPAKISDLVAYNQKVKLEVGDLCPIVKPEKMKSETLASQHLNLFFRLTKSGARSPLTGMVFVVDKDPKLEAELVNGHRFWIFKGTISKDDMKFVCDYKNSGQNQDNFFSCFEMTRAVQMAYLHEKNRLASEGKVATEVKAATIVAKICQGSVVKLKPENVLDTCKWICALCPDPGSFVDEYLWFVNTNINPREKCVSSRWLGEAASIIPAKYGIVALNIAIVHTEGENVLQQTRPQVMILLTSNVSIHPL